jgi:hypothetical protein
MGGKSCKKERALSISISFFWRFISPHSTRSAKTFAVKKEHNNNNMNFIFFINVSKYYRFSYKRFAMKLKKKPKTTTTTTTRNRFNGLFPLSSLSLSSQQDNNSTNRLNLSPREFIISLAVESRGGI